VAVPATTGGSLAVAIEGHPWRDLDGNGLPSSDERIGVPNAISYAPIGAGTASPRRQVVEIAKCNDCHESLSVHGNNRSDAPEVCATCHNPNATDTNLRAGQCLADLGADDSPLDFKVMVHRIHASGATGVPFEVCGFGNSAQVFDFVYPGKLNDCEGCHVEGSYYPSSGAARLATTVDAGADPIAVTDDTVVSPNAAVCSTCHVSALAAEHMRQNGADFAAAKAADGSLISAGVETCALCHGPGRLADVELVHGVDRFLFND
jgi:OmcA/MtrC family decaheme c-type cytochrome